jgi:uncharacterized protein (TIGR03067 family)
MKTHLLTLVIITFLVASGCATKRPADADAIQGTWKGQEVRQGGVAGSWLMLIGQEIEFRAVDGKEWYKGTYQTQASTDPKQLTAVIAQCPQAEYVGKTVLGIYQLETDGEGHGRLVITANEPGNPRRPTDFGDRQARQIIFTKE